MSRSHRSAALPGTRRGSPCGEDRRSDSPQRGRSPRDRPGKVTGDAVEGTARPLDGSDLTPVRSALRRESGWRFRLLRVAEVPLRFVRRAGTPVGIAVTLTSPAPVADSVGADWIAI